MKILLRAKGFLLSCVMTLLCLSGKVSVGPQGVTLSLFVVAPVLAESGIVLSDEGTTVQLGNRVIYMDDLTRNDVEWVGQSFIYGGVMSTLFSVMALSYGYYFHYYWLNSYYVAIFGMLISSLFYVDAILTRLRFGYALVQSLFSLDYPMPYAAIAFMVLTREEQDVNNPLQRHVNPKILLLLPLVKLLSLQFLEDKNDKTSTGLTLTGHAAGMFIIHIEPEPYARGLISYKLERTKVNELNPNPDGFSALATAMDEINLSAIHIVPLAPQRYSFTSLEQDSVEDVEEPETVASLALVFFRVHDESEPVKGILTQRSSDLDKPKVFSPYLLHAFSNHHDRLTIAGVRTLLAPVFLEEVAEFLNEYGRNDTTQLKKDAIGNVWRLSNYDSESLGDFADIQHTEDNSYFTLPAANGSPEVSVTWSSSPDGQETLALDSGCNDGDNCVVAQYLVPAWVNKLLSLQLAYLGYTVGFDLAKKALHVFHSDKVLPNFPVEKYSGNEESCPVCKDPDKSLLSLQCGHPLCQSCQDTLIQRQLNDNQFSAWKLQSFGIKCPMCTQKSSFTLLP